MNHLFPSLKKELIQDISLNQRNFCLIFFLFVLFKETFLWVYYIKN